MINAIIGIGISASKVSCQLISTLIMMSTAHPITNESTNVKTPSPAANTTRSTSFVVRAIRSPFDTYGKTLDSADLIADKTFVVAVQLTYKKHQITINAKYTATHTQPMQSTA